MMVEVIFKINAEPVHKHALEQEVGLAAVATYLREMLRIELLFANLKQMAQDILNGDNSIVILGTGSEGKMMIEVIVRVNAEVVRSHTLRHEAAVETIATYLKEMIRVKLLFVDLLPVAEDILNGSNSVIVLNMEAHDNEF